MKSNIYVRIYYELSMNEVSMKIITSRVAYVLYKISKQKLFPHFFILVDRRNPIDE